MLPQSSEIISQLQQSQHHCGILASQLDMERQQYQAAKQQIAELEQTVASMQSLVDANQTLLQTIVDISATITAIAQKSGVHSSDIAM